VKVLHASGTNLQDINAAIEATHTVDAASLVMFSGRLVHNT
jgi:hypothetical protein